MKKFRGLVLWLSCALFLMGCGEDEALDAYQAYEAEEFNPNYEEAAREYYQRANIRLQYIVMLLHGEIPEGEGITYTEEDNSIFGDGYLNKSDDDSEEGTGEDTGDGTEGTQE